MFQRQVNFCKRTDFFLTKHVFKFLTTIKVVVFLLSIFFFCIDAGCIVRAKMQVFAKQHHIYNVYLDCIYLKKFDKLTFFQKKNALCVSITWTSSLQIWLYCIHLFLETGNFYFHLFFFQHWPQQNICPF